MIDLSTYHFELPSDSLFMVSNSAYDSVGATTSRVISVISCIVIDLNMYSVVASKTYRPVNLRCTMTREKGTRTHPEDFYIIYSDNNYSYISNRQFSNYSQMNFLQ